MSLETDVLRALLRLARRRTPPTLDSLVVRVGGEAPAVKEALRALAQKGLVQRTESAPGVGLTMAGLAVAVAVVARRASAATKLPKQPKPQQVAKKPARRTERRAA